MPLAPSTLLGPYEILSLIGVGGMGEVYRARDKRLNRDVAIKVLGEGLAKDQDRRARFEREARAVAALNHPNIVSLFDIGTEGDVQRARHKGQRVRIGEKRVTSIRVGWSPSNEGRARDGPSMDRDGHMTLSTPGPQPVFVFDSKWLPKLGNPQGPQRRAEQLFP